MLSSYVLSTFFLAGFAACNPLPASPADCDSAFILGLSSGFPGSKLYVTPGAYFDDLGYPEDILEHVDNYLNLTTSTSKASLFQLNSTTGQLMSGLGVAGVISGADPDFVSFGGKAWYDYHKAQLDPVICRIEEYGGSVNGAIIECSTKDSPQAFQWCGGRSDWLGLQIGSNVGKNCTEITLRSYCPDVDSQR
jgi:hypothetical protein